MRRALIYIFALIYLSMACNPMRRALREKELVDQAIAEYLLNNPTPNDTTYIKGDTIVMRDTLVTLDTIVDTLRQHKIVKEVRTVNNVTMVRDTIVERVYDNSMLTNCQRHNLELREENAYLRGRNKANIVWLIAFGIVVLICIIIMTRR